MINGTNNKRLVLIGISRKGEKGFRKSVDPKQESAQPTVSTEILPIPDHAAGNSSSIMTLLPE